MSGATISVSMRLDNGLLFSMGGTDWDDFEQNLYALYKSEPHANAVIFAMREAIMPIAAGQQAATNVVHGAFPQAQQYNGPPAPTPDAIQQNRPSANVPPPGSNVPSCVHGQRVYKSGTSGKSGKPYKLWSCPASGNQQCAPEWID